MNPSRTRRVRFLSGGAAGVLALAALAVSSPAAEAAVTGARAAAPAASAALPAANKKLAKKATRTVRVRTSSELRKAVAQANNRPGLDRIILTDGMALNADSAGNGGALRGDLDVLDNLTISGAGFTINARGVDRIFDVPSGTRLALNNLTLRGGAAPTTENGGAVRSAGVLILKNVTAAHNSVSGEGASGGAFANEGGALRMYGSTVGGNSAVRAGGAIEAVGGTTVINTSNLAGNSAGDLPGNGGAVHLTGSGIVNIDASRVAHNSAAAEGGGLWNSDTGQMTVTDTNVVHNTASGAAADQGGGGLYNDGGTLNVVRSGVSANAADGAAGSGGAILNNLGTLVVRNANLAMNTANRAGGAIEANVGTTSVVESILDGNDAGTAPGNGGALHLTGAGTVDVEGGRVTDNTAVEGGGLWNSLTGSMSVVRVLVQGNTTSGDDATQGGALYNDGGNLSVRGAEVTDNTATGTSGSGGGLLSVAGNVDVFNTTFTNNGAQRAGGAIEVVEGVVGIRQSTLNLNDAGANPGNGGAVHVSGAATVTVAGSELVNNTATREGGGLWNSATGTMTVRRTGLTANSADGPAADDGGGAIFNNGGSLTVEKSVLDGNAATGAAGSGGGLFTIGGGVDVSETDFSGNSANRAGGGVEIVAGTVTIADSTLSGNDAGGPPGNGGAVHVSGAASTTVTGSLVDSNTAANEGGGLWSSATGTMTVLDSEVSGNSAAGNDATNGGGGLFQDAGGSLTVSGSTVHDNQATGTAGSGGGLLNDQGAVTVTDSSFSMNSAVRAGGGIEQNVGTSTLTDVDLDGNTAGAAPGNGGGIHVTGAGTTTYTGGALTNNAAANEGGGFWCSAAGTFTATGLTFSGNTAPAGPDGYFQLPGTPGTCTVNGTPLAPGGFTAP